MSDKDTTTPAEEVTQSEETVNDEQESEETVGSFQEEETQQDERVSDNIPKARLDKEINRRKALEAELAELKEKKEEDETVSNTDKDPEVKELAAKLAKIEENEKRAAQDVKLTAALNKALDNAPEYKDIANLALIKQMAMNPSNKEKTFPQLLDEAYGNAIPGKRTTETTTPRGGANDTKVDLARAASDPVYKREVLADPDLRAQYNADLPSRLNL